jgi:hypothetical protein
MECGDLVAKITARRSMVPSHFRCDLKVERGARGEMGRDREIPSPHGCLGFLSCFAIFCDVHRFFATCLFGVAKFTTTHFLNYDMSMQLR